MRCSWKCILLSILSTKIYRIPLKRQFSTKGAAASLSTQAQKLAEWHRNGGLPCQQFLAAFMASLDDLSFVRVE